MAVAEISLQQFALDSGRPKLSGQTLQTFNGARHEHQIMSV
jgi:hypothetical protein